MTTIPDRRDIDKLTNGDFKMTRAMEDLFQRVSVAEDGITSGADATQGLANATVVLLSANDGFGNARILAVSQPLALDDNGAGGTLNLGFNFPFTVNGGFALTLNLQADTILDFPTSGTVITDDYIYPGPFTNDAAAATGGVGVGQTYRASDGSMKWRQA